MGAPRRAGSPRRHRRPGAPRRISWDRDPPRGKVAHSPRRASGRAVAHADLAQARGVFVRCAPVRRRAFAEMHLVMLQAMLPAPFEIVPLLVGEADPQSVAEALRRVWGGPETVVAVSSDLSHFLDQRSAEAIDSDTGRLIETLDAAALDERRAYSFSPARARSKSPPSATCARPACIWRPRRILAATPRGSSATALSRSSTRLRPGLMRPTASVCFQPAWPLSAWRRRPAANSRAEPRLRIAGAFALARDLCHLDRERPASRLHRFAQAPPAAPSTTRSPTRRRRRSPTRALRRSSHPNWRRSPLRDGPTSSGPSLTTRTPTCGTRTRFMTIPTGPRGSTSSCMTSVRRGQRHGRDRHDPEAAPSGSCPGLCSHCAMHCYRTEGWNRKVATPWMQFTGLISTGHGPQQPIAVTLLDREPDHRSRSPTGRRSTKSFTTTRPASSSRRLMRWPRGKQGQAESIVTWTNILQRQDQGFWHDAGP